MDKLTRTIRLIEKQVQGFDLAGVTEVSKKHDPYRVLISCILSLRTKDEVTAEASKRLFKVAHTPSKMVKLPESTIQRLIYPVGFYRNKAKVIVDVSRRIIEDFGGRVPATQEDLLTLRGVGLKTANLVLGLGYNIASICVDTHVHKISNRLGWCATPTPEQTEKRLQKLVPEKYWIRLNTFLVAFGQRICTSISPRCSACYVTSLCKKVGLKRYR
ncbi:MAG: endonuclease III [Candidatus Omnitrophota bacterium]|nr:MAG: endonuclease III [Candidatus Omnitrophota bacterium]